MRKNKGNIAKIYLSFVLLALIVGCSENDQAVKGRWYTQEQVVNGTAIFKTNCAACHGDEAQGIVPDWNLELADGSYPPPPLDGSAHAWHHPMQVLKRTIRNGGIPLGGKMPPFKDSLNGAEIESVIAYFQNKWNDKIYDIWVERGGLR